MAILRIHQAESFAKLLSNRNRNRHGLVRLHRGVRGAVRPEVPYRDVRLEMTLS